MWGRDLLVAPVFKKGATSREVYLPAGEWYDWWTNVKSAGGQAVTRAVDLATMPIYVRAGAIIPVDPVRQYTSEPVRSRRRSRSIAAPTVSTRCMKTMGSARSI